MWLHLIKKKAVWPWKPVYVCHENWERWQSWPSGVITPTSGLSSPENLVWCVSPAGRWSIAFTCATGWSSISSLLRPTRRGKIQFSCFWRQAFLWESSQSFPPYVGFFYPFPFWFAWVRLQILRLLTFRIHICTGMFEPSATKLCVGSTLTLEIYLPLPSIFLCASAIQNTWTSNCLNGNAINIYIKKTS